MAERRTEPPTGRRLADARRDGQVAISRRLTGAAALAGGAAAALIVAPPAVDAALARMIEALRAAPQHPDPIAAVGAVGLGSIVGEVARVAAPIAAAAAIAALVCGLIQTRGLLAARALRWDFSRLSPRAGLGRALSGRGVGEGIGAALALAAIAGVCIVWLLGHADDVLALTGRPPRLALAAGGALAAGLLIRVATAAAIAGAADWAWRRWLHRRDLMMTRTEKRRERREHEGDPRIRRERRRRHAALVAHPAAAVMTADVAIAGREWVAALRYPPGADAPIVVAAGQRLVAHRLLALARRARVPIHPGEALARALAAVPVGAEIPAARYEAVARVFIAVATPTTPAIDPTKHHPPQINLPSKRR
jgi:flagellar biosynthesis protein FlhB